MEKNRILPFQLSQKISEKDLESISAAGTTTGTLEATYGGGQADVSADFTTDI